MARTVQETRESSALLWLMFRSTWMAGGLSVVKNWGRAPGYLPTIMRGDGTTLGTFPTMIPGKRYAGFDGGDWFDTGLVDRFSHATPFSFLCRAERMTGADCPLIADYDSATTKGMRLRYNATTGRLWFDWYKDGANYISAYATDIVPIQSHVYGVTYDGSGGFSGVRLYQDGVSLTLTDASLGTADANLSGKSLLLGANHNGAAKAQFVNGVMTGAALYPFALTPTQMAEVSLRLKRDAGLI